MPGMARTRRVLTILETGTTGTVHTETGHQETDLQERRTPHTLNSTHGIPTTEIGTGILGTVITSLARSAVQDMIVSSWVQLCCFNSINFIFPRPLNLSIWLPDFVSIFLTVFILLFSCWSRRKWDRFSYFMKFLRVLKRLDFLNG